jgi:KOW motif-containing protein
MYGYEIGDFVRVLRGPFEGFPGTVTGADGGNLVVDVKVFGESTPVLLPPEDLARIDPRDGEGGSPVREPRIPHEPSGSDAIEIEIEGDEATP